MNTRTISIAICLILIGGCDGATMGPDEPAQRPSDPPQPPPAPPGAGFASPGRLAFVSTRDGESWIYTADPDGTDPISLVRGHSPTWSRDGGTLAFVSEHPHTTEIRALEADGRSRLLATGGHDPAWSADGARVAFVREAGIFVVDADGSDERLLVGVDSLQAWTGFGTGPNDDQAMWGVAWSPDGRWIASAAFGREGGQPVLLVTDSEGRAPMPGAAPITVGFESSIDWSPDGRRLLFSKGVQVRPGVWTERIVTLEVATWTEATLPFGGAHPRWSSDGGSVLFTSPPPWSCHGEPCAARIWVGDPVTGRIEQLVADAPATARPYTDTHVDQAPVSD